MGLLDKLKGEFIDIIEWTDDSRDTLVYRFQRYDNEIKNGAKLTVREGQFALFVNEGKLADVFKPGLHTLDTKNLPILSTLLGWKHGFSSPFKAEVYFVNTRPFTNVKWGTPTPWLYNDPEMGPVKLRAHGNFEFRVSAPPVFLRHLIGTSGMINIEDVQNTLRGELIAEIGDAIGETKIPVGDMLANFKELGQKITTLASTRISQTFGLELLKLQFASIDLPPEYDQILKKRAEMKAFGVNYMQLQAGAAMEQAAQNSSGMAGLGAGVGAGVGIGQMMGQAFQTMGQPAVAAAPGVVGAPTPPPLPLQEQYFVAMDGQQQGPFDQQTLRQLVQTGRLTAQTLVWKQGMAAWTAAAQVPAIAAILTSMPPPLPKG